MRRSRRGPRGRPGSLAWDTPWPPQDGVLACCAGGVCCLSVVLWRQAGPRGVLCCVAPQRFLRQLGDGDEAMSHEYILDKMSTVENVYKARWLLIAQMLVLSSPCCLIS